MVYQKLSQTDQNAFAADEHKTSPEEQQSDDWQTVLPDENDDGYDSTQLHADMDDGSDEEDITKTD